MDAIKKIRASDIRAQERAAATLRRGYLRGNGWAYSCDWPGSLWLWSKTLPDGRVIATDDGTAFAIQETLTPDDPYYADDADD